MTKTIKSLFCFSFLFLSALVGNQVTTKIQVTEAFPRSVYSTQTTTVPLPRPQVEVENASKNTSRQLTPQIKQQTRINGRSQNTPRKEVVLQPAKQPTQRAVSAPVQRHNNRVSTRPLVENPSLPSSAVVQQRFDERPLPQTSNARPANTQRSAPVIVPTNRVQRPANVVLATPRPQVSTPLPSTVQLDQRCAPCSLVMLRPYTIAPRGNTLELVDGSVWHVQRKRDRRKVRSWSAWDNLAIESTQFLGWTTFTLVNYTRNESIEATMKFGPTYEGKASHWISQVNPYQRKVVLEDGSNWSFIEASFGDWRENDAVVLGLSKNSSGNYVYMLINTRTLKCSLAINSVL